jgi:integrase
MSLRFSRLTRPAIRALENGERLHEHGITAERLKTGDVRYSVNVMVDSQRVHRVIGRESEGVTREQAERAVESFRTKAREGRLDLPSGRKTYRSFTEGAEEYLTRLSETNGKDMANKTRHVRKYLIPSFGTHRLDQLKPFALQQYRKKRASAGAPEATINREMSTLSHLLNRATEWKWIKSEDKPPIPKAAEKRKPIRILTPEQADALMDGAIADQDGRLWLFVEFGLGAAMRHSEILRVRYDQVDFEHSRIWISKAKAGEREQPITPSLRDALARQREMEPDKGGWVFPACRVGGKAYRHAMAVPFARAVVRAGLDPTKVTPHLMRHTAISKLVMAGVDLPTIQRISGHKTLSMVLHYTHVHGVHIDNAIAVLDRPMPGTITQDLHTSPTSAQSGQAVESQLISIVSAA